jgi:NAD+ synthase (glutamine-hydrolysing)
MSSDETKKRPADATPADEKVAKVAKTEPKLHADLVKKLEEYRAKRAFDAKKWVQEKCEMFNKYMTKCGLKACCVSLSGGVDSAVTLAMMKHASQMKDSSIKKVVGIAQPIHSSAWALNRATECANKLGAELVTIDQTALHTQLTKLVDDAVGIQGKPFATGQLRSYMRTPTGYYVAQLISQSGLPCVVMGTGNKDEDGYLAYFCKAGDGVVDVQLIADIHKSEVFKVGAELGVPKSILVAAPSADLWDGQTDEEELGFTYDFIELFTGMYLPLSDDGKKAFTESLSAEGLKQFTEWSKACESVHNRNKHKFDSPHNINIY